MTTRDSERNSAFGDSHDDSHEDLHDPVAEYFVTRGVSSNVRRKGLRGIIAQWEAIAQTAARYDLTLDDWLNDVDLRDIIAGAMSVAPDKQQQEMRDALDRADELFRDGTIETRRSLWGDATAASDRHEPKRQWWYFRRPANPGDNMRADLANAGIV